MNKVHEFLSNAMIRKWNKNVYMSKIENIRTINGLK